MILNVKIVVSLLPSFHARLRIRPDEQPAYVLGPWSSPLLHLAVCVVFHWTYFAVEQNIWVTYKCTLHFLG